MGNNLNEMTDYVNAEGRAVNVIEKQLPVKVGIGSTFFQIALWVGLFIPLAIVSVFFYPLPIWVWPIGVLPGVIFIFVKVNAEKELNQLEQKLQHDASQIDNYLEQRVVVLQNCAKLIDRAVALDKDTFSELAATRSGAPAANADAARNEYAGKIESASRQLYAVYENYPQLGAHKEIKQAMQSNQYLQTEITAARELYNDTVYMWNKAIFEWPAKMIVAAKRGYTTRIPFSTSAEIKKQSTAVFF